MIAIKFNVRYEKCVVSSPLFIKKAREYIFNAELISTQQGFLQHDALF